jgi:hypothetical protein
LLNTRDKLAPRLSVPYQLFLCGYSIGRVGIIRNITSNIMYAVAISEHPKDKHDIRMRSQTELRQHNAYIDGGAHFKIAVWAKCETCKFCSPKRPILLTTKRPSQFSAFSGLPLSPLSETAGSCEFCRQHDPECPAVLPGGVEFEDPRATITLFTIADRTVRFGCRLGIRREFFDPFSPAQSGTGGTAGGSRSRRRRREMM